MPPSEIGYLPASAVLDFIHPGARILVPAEAAEPATLLDAIDAAGPTLQDVQIHWMDPFTTRPFQQGAYPGRLTHVNYFLGAGSRDSYHAGHSELVCADFSQIPAILRGQVKPTLAISHCSLPDAEGYRWGRTPTMWPLLSALSRFSWRLTPMCRTRMAHM